MESISGTPSKQCRVLVFDDTPTPYRMSLFAEVVKRDAINLTVAYLAKRGLGKLWKLPIGEMAYGIKWLSSFQWHIRAIDTTFQINFGMHSVIRSSRPDVIVVGGYHHVAYWLILAYCRIYRIPLIVWSGTTDLSEWRSGNHLLASLKTLYLRSTTRCMVYGSAAKRFVLKHGISEDSIDVVLNTTDLSRFRLAWLSSCNREDNERDVTRFIFSGRLTPLKGLQNTLRAFSLLPNKQFEFRVVGDGHFRSEAERLVADLGITDRVQFVGFAQQEDLALHLVWADIFIFASVQEVWGIVVNEAIASGLFVLSSKRAGVTEDLVVEAETGLVIDPYSVNSIYDSICYCLKNISLIRQKRAERSQWIQKFSAESVSESFVRSATAAVVAPGAWQ